MMLSCLPAEALPTIGAGDLFWCPTGGGWVTYNVGCWPTAHYLAFYPSAAMFNTNDLPYSVMGDEVVFDTRGAKSWSAVPVRATRRADDTWKVVIFYPESGTKETVIFREFYEK